MFCCCVETPGSCILSNELDGVLNKAVIRLAQLIAEDLGVAGYNTAVNDERNKGAFVMGAESMDIERLLSRSQSLAQGKGKGGGK